MQNVFPDLFLLNTEASVSKYNQAGATWRKSGSATSEGRDKSENYSNY